jgi:Cytochrome c554 and c-prime
VASSALRWLIPVLTITAENITAGTEAAVRMEGHMSSPRYLGAASCSSSSCHGGAGERHNQFIVWSQRDFHQRASLILTNARSARVAETLGINDAAFSTRCTVCHSPLTTISSARLSDKNHPDNGVSCESCHGPAEAWLRSHTRRDYTYAMRVSAGMRDLRNLYVRANACVACHQSVDTDIVAAGHPRLVFELSTQTKAQPPHWRDPADSPVKAWLTGQAVALRELSWKMQGGGHNSDRDAAAQTSALAWLLSKVTSSDRSLPLILEDADSDTLHRAADQLARQVSARTFENGYSPTVLQMLTSLAAEFSRSSPVPADVLFYRAKRLAVACVALSETASHPPVASAELGRILEDVSSPVNFDASVFAEHLAAWRVTATTQ